MLGFRVSGFGFRLPAMRDPAKTMGTPNPQAPNTQTPNPEPPLLGGSWVVISGLSGVIKVG